MSRHDPRPAVVGGAVLAPQQHLGGVGDVALCDLSVVVTSAGCNPTLTLAALARRPAALPVGE